MRVNGKWRSRLSEGEYTARTATLTKLREFKKDKEAELRTTHVDVVKGVTVGDLFDDYIKHLERKEEDKGAYMGVKTQRSSYVVASQVNANLRKPFGKLKPEKIDTAMLENYKDNRNREGASVVTINRELGYLRTALINGSKHKPRKVNPLLIQDLNFKSVINVQAEKLAARSRVITADEQGRLFVHLAPHLRPVFMTCFYVGIRPKEMRFIRRAQVDLKHCVIHLRNGETKNTRGRDVVLNPDLCSVLCKWEQTTKEKHPNTEWFFHYEGRQLGTWKTAWNAALKRAGLPGVDSRCEIRSQHPRCRLKSTGPH